jgi:hypothetical protein
MPPLPSPPRRALLVQLPLPLYPLSLPIAGSPLSGPATQPVPKQVWGRLSPPERARLQQTLVAVLQEVVRVRDAP